MSKIKEAPPVVGATDEAHEQASNTPQSTRRNAARQASREKLTEAARASVPHAHARMLLRVREHHARPRLLRTLPAGAAWV